MTKPFPVTSDPFDFDLDGIFEDDDMDDRDAKGFQQHGPPTNISWSTPKPAEERAHVEISPEARANIRRAFAS